MTTKPWAGRFEKATDKLVEAFTASIQTDQRMARHDIVGSIAHVRMLGRQGIITTAEQEAIAQGLRAIWRDLQSGARELSAEYEDVHMNVETLLSDRVGAVGGKLHTARSRNDQVALDARLYARELIADTAAAVCGLQAVLAELAERHSETIFPGYTHLQRAQPVVLGHHFLAYFEMLERDQGRLRDCYARANVLPLGSGALAGVPYPIDRESVARELGFAAVTANSLDAVSDRDFMLEYEAAASICMMHLSRLAEETVLWSSQEFGLIELDDGFATGSSMMPQKKNPDVAELVRGKTGQIYGNLLALLTTMKGLPLSYNRDLQEDKPGFFQTGDTLVAALQVFAPMLASMRVKPEMARLAAEGGYSLATDLADYLAERGLPFREAHHCVGALVSYALQQGKTFGELTLEEFQRCSPQFGPDALEISTARSLAARSATGGTAPQTVARAAAAAQERLSAQTPLSAPVLDPETFGT